MKIIKIILIILIMLLPLAAHADETNDKFRSAIAASIGGGSSLSLRRSINTSTDIITEGKLYFYSNEISDNDGGNRNYKRANFSISAGLRKYLSKGEYSIFWQGLIGPKYEYRTSNYYNDSDEDKERSLDNTHTLGLDFKLGIGAEYNYSKSISVEIAYFTRASRSSIHLSGNEKEISTDLNTFTNVSLNYYW